MHGEILQRILGHANYSTTANVYTHLDPETITNAATNMLLTNAKTAEKVAYASTRTYEELVELSREEMTGATDTFKVLGLTSMLKKAVEQLIKKYDFT